MSINSSFTIKNLNYNFDLQYDNLNLNGDLDVKGKVTGSNLKKEAVFELQVLHTGDADIDSNMAVNNLKNFSGLVQQFKNEYPERTIFLSCGDNFTQNVRYKLSANTGFTPLLQSIRDASYVEAFEGRADIAILDSMNLQVSTLGNHEFNKGSSTLAKIIGASDNWNGAQFPYLAYNADFSNDSSLLPLVVPNGQEASDVKGKITGWVKITLGNGEVVGILGVITPLFKAITDVRNINIIGSNNSTDIDSNLLAAKVQEGIDEIRASGINKVIILSHLQKVIEERKMARLLKGASVIIAGGSTTLVGNNRPYENDEFEGPYPFYETSLSGNVPIVTVNRDYKYVGRMILGFDSEGKLVHINNNLTDNYGTNRQDITSGYTEFGKKLAIAHVLPNAKIIKIIDKFNEIYESLPNKIYGYTNVLLEGNRESSLIPFGRSSIRREETNLGNLIVDSYVWYAKHFDENVSLALINSGGMRTSINPGDYENIAIDKLIVDDVLQFSNDLYIISLTGTQVRNVLETSVEKWASGGFIQVSGIRYSYEPKENIIYKYGSRVRNAVLETGEEFIKDGEILLPDRVFRVVLGSFQVTRNESMDLSYNGGDDIPLPAVSEQNRINLAQQENPSSFTYDTLYRVGEDKEAFARYILEFYSGITNGVADRPFTIKDTPMSEDTRIQRLSERSDSIFN